MKKTKPDTTPRGKLRTLEIGETIKRLDMMHIGGNNWICVPDRLIDTTHTGLDTIHTSRISPGFGTPTLPDVIHQKLNRLEIDRDRLRAEIDQPPADAGVYYFTDRLGEHRTLCLMIDAIRDLLR